MFKDIPGYADRISQRERERERDMKWGGGEEHPKESRKSLLNTM